jgi:hypothetical protein
VGSPVLVQISKSGEAKRKCDYDSISTLDDVDKNEQYILNFKTL